MTEESAVPVEDSTGLTSAGDLHASPLHTDPLHTGLPADAPNELPDSMNPHIFGGKTDGSGDSINSINPDNSTSPAGPPDSHDPSIPSTPSESEIRQELASTSARLRALHPVVWALVIPLGLLVLWEVLGGVLSLASGRFDDGVLSIANDLLAAPLFIWCYLRTRGTAPTRGSKPARGSSLPNPSRWTWTLAIGLLVLLVFEYFAEQSIYVGIQPLLPHTDEPNYQQEMYDQNEMSFYILAVAVAPPVEELMYRGVLYGRLRVINVWVANAVQVVLFTLAHPVLSFMPAIAIFAFFQALVFEATGRLWVCMLVHAISNSGVLTYLYSAVGIDLESVPLSVSLPVYLLAWAVLIVLYCRVRTVKRPAEEEARRADDDLWTQDRWQRIATKLAAARVQVLPNGRVLWAAPAFVMPGVALGYAAGYAGQGYAAPGYATPGYATPSYAVPQYPRYADPRYAAPGHGVPRYPSTPYPAPQYQASQYQASQPTSGYGSTWYGHASTAGQLAQAQSAQVPPAQAQSAQAQSPYAQPAPSWQSPNQGGETRFMPPASATPQLPLAGTVAANPGNDDDDHAHTDDRGDDERPVNAEH